MNGATKPILAALLFLLFLAGCALSFLYAFYPRTGDIDEIPSETTPEKLARGEYLSRHVAACVACHSERDFELYSGPVRPGSEWAGGERWTQEQGLPGTITAPNISPYALKNWTNEEIGRSIRGRGFQRWTRPVSPDAVPGIRQPLPRGPERYRRLSTHLGSEREGHPTDGIGLSNESHRSAHSRSERNAALSRA